MEEYNESKQWARIKAGYRGGIFNAQPMLMKRMTIVDGVPDTTREMLQGSKTPAPGGVTDPWVYKHNKM